MHAEALNTPTMTFHGSESGPRELPFSFRVAPLPGDCASFTRLLARFEPISLARMNDVALMDRTDTKYVMNVNQLHSTLGLLSDHYRVLEIAGVRLNRYQTLYFDTDDLATYLDHHAGKQNRYKVRSREYLDTGVSFLEVKRKGKRDRTMKNRLQTPEFRTKWLPEAASLLPTQDPAEMESLGPKVMTFFSRGTLVSRRLRERITIDLGLEFWGNGRSVAMPRIAIAEVKQDGVNRDSDFVRQMRAAGIRPCGFSKYCIAVALLYQQVKHNRFKPKLRLIRDLMGGDYDA